MATLAATYGFHLNQPWLLLAAMLVVPIIWLGRRNLTQLGRVRRTLAITMRVLVVLVLALLLARPTMSRENESLTVIAVLDRSKSVPEELKAKSLAYLNKALEAKPSGDRVALVNVAESAFIASLPSESSEIQEREVNLDGNQSRLAAGLQLGMAIAPPETATRLLLISDGNETAGDLLEAARIAAANNIPIDVLPLTYSHKNEVIVRRLAAPPTARAKDSVPLRFVLTSTGPAKGHLMLKMNGKNIGMQPLTLKKGTNVSAYSVPVPSAGTYRFEGTFIADGDEKSDTIEQNNTATAVTYVAGPGHVLVVDGDGKGSLELIKALAKAGIDARPLSAEAFPSDLTELLSADAVMLVNVSNSFTVNQQDMLVRYVNDLGRGLVMIGGPESFGAGGWIGSPVAEILPVDLDPPQKKEMPRGALVMAMHACEFARGNYWGKRVAIAATKTLSSEDYVGVLYYDWEAGNKWAYKLQKAGNKKRAISAINKMNVGDMMDFGPHLTAAYTALKNVNAGQKHIIIISDGDPSPPSPALIRKFKKAGITITCVCVFPHGGQVPRSFVKIAKDTGGNFYNPSDPSKLPQIFVKEAQIVRRSLIIEREFTPSVSDPTSDVIRGFGGLPKLNGYVLTGERGGLATTVLKAGDDPLLAIRQSGLGRTAAFTSSADSRWAASWVGWSGFERFWKQLSADIARSRSQGDCQIYADVQGQEVNLSVEAVDVKGKFVQFTALEGSLVSPDMKLTPLDLTQIGPGRYRTRFDADKSGSYLVNLRYRKAGGGKDATGSVQTVVTVPYAPEFRDLTDNRALLELVAQETGGRVLPGKPEDARLFDRSAVNMPRTFLPLTIPLLILWLALFLTDVAVRRISIDFAAGGRWVVTVPGRLRGAKGEAGQTLTQLQSARQKVREELKAGRTKSKEEPQAHKRYEGAKEAKGGPPPLPIADVDKTRRESPAPAEPAKKESKPTPITGGPEHLQRLLRAKRKAGGDKKKD